MDDYYYTKPYTCILIGCMIIILLINSIPEDTSQIKMIKIKSLLVTYQIIVYLLNLLVSAISFNSKLIKFNKLTIAISLITSILINNWYLNGHLIIFSITISILVFNFYFVTHCISHDNVLFAKIQQNLLIIFNLIMISIVLSLKDICFIYCCFRDSFNLKNDYEQLSNIYNQNRQSIIDYYFLNINYLILKLIFIFMLIMFHKLYFYLKYFQIKQIQII